MADLPETRYQQYYRLNGYQYIVTSDFIRHEVLIFIRSGMPSRCVFTILLGKRSYSVSPIARKAAILP